MGLRGEMLWLMMMLLCVVSLRLPVLSLGGDDVLRFAGGESRCWRTL
jgi:hypothetical protein